MENSHWVEDWLAARAEAPKTKVCYTQSLVVFVEFCRTRWGKDFFKVVEEWRAARLQGPAAQDVFTDEWTDIVKNYNTHVKPLYAPLTVKNLLVVVKSFFRYWKVPVDVDLPRRACVIYHNRDMTREEIRQILTYASPRDRVIWLIMVESGMRGATAIGVKYWQIKEDFEKGITPMRILTPAAALKDHVGDRWTFIGEDGFKALKEYLTHRLPMKDDDYVFASERPGRVAGDQFSVASLSVKFNRLTQKLAMDKPRQGKPKSVRMHGLRKYFRNNMKVEAAYREFWAGHSLGVDAHYITRDPEVHRKEYSKGYEFLRLFEPSVVSMTELLSDIRKKTLQIDGLKEQNQKMAGQIRDLTAAVVTAVNFMADSLGKDNISPDDLKQLLKKLQSG